MGIGQFAWLFSDVYYYSVSMIQIIDSFEKDMIRSLSPPPLERDQSYV